MWHCEMFLCSVEFVLLNKSSKAQGTCTISKTSKHSKSATLSPFGFGLFGMWICEILLCALEFVVFKEN